MRSHFDMVNNVEYVNLKPYLQKSFQDYQFYITDNDLNKLTRKESNQLGIHFILNQILTACQASTNKKCFFYQVEDEASTEKQLVKRIFNVLPSRVIFETITFEEFIKEDCEYYPYVPIDTSKISWKRFKMFLKRQNLTMLEKKFIDNINVKLSLLH